MDGRSNEYYAFSRDYISLTITGIYVNTVNHLLCS